MVFSAVWCQNKEHKTSQGCIPSRFQKKKKKKSAHTQWISMDLAPGKRVLSSTEHQHWCPRKRGIYSLFLKWTFFTPGQHALSLIIKQMSSVYLTGHQQAVLLAQNSSQLIYKPEDFPMPPCVNIYQLDKFSQWCFDKPMSPVQLWCVGGEGALKFRGRFCGGETSGNLSEVKLNAGFFCLFVFPVYFFTQRVSHTWNL